MIFHKNVNLELGWTAYLLALLGSLSNPSNKEGVFGT